MSGQDPKTELHVLELLELALCEASDARASFIDNAAGYTEAVRKRVRAILASGDGAAPIRTDGASAYTLALAQPPSRIGSYRIIREIGRGGMGAVFEADRDQGDFDHKVAIKIIATGRLSDKLVARFTQERQILAGLNHPHIARLYDGGETESGLPYLVMELVEGEPLKAWLERGQDEAACFAVLQQILKAVEYAHRTLVIHRDLTPSNVIITADGGVKLIDFGISSFPSSSAPPLISGETATPGYAAPESSGGDSQSTAIDIYALGKLMQLMFQRANQPEITAIANKAAAVDPEARYTAVSHLAADVERYQTGYPVGAYEGGGSYTAKKYVRRNWLLLGMAATVALIIAASVSLLANSYREEQTARKLAANRFEAVRDLGTFQLFDLYDAMDDIPNTVRARQLVASKSISYLNTLAITPDAPPDLRREVGEGWLRLAQVTGGSSGDHIGLPEDASVFGRRALDILESLYGDDPDDPKNRLALGDALGTLAFSSLYMEGDSEAGYARAAQAVDLLAHMQPSNERTAIAIAKAYRALGDAHGWKSELEQAGVAYSKGLDVVHALPPALQNTKGILSVTSPLMRQLAEVYRYTGEPDKALAQMRKTVKFNERVLALSANSDGSAERRNLVIVLWNIADLHRSLEQWAEGFGYADRALAMIDTAIKQNPEDIGWLELRPQNASVMAQLKSGNGEHADALLAADSAISALRSIRQRSGSNAGADLSLAVGWKDVAHVYRRAGKPDIACAGLQEAGTIFAAYEKSGKLSAYDRDNNWAPVREALGQC